MPARDEFTKETKDILAKRVGLRCSNPNCRRPTSGPQAHPRKTVNIGVAAHIAAAAPGGPRYDDKMTPEERCGIENAVWLCQNCAKLIDNDAPRYTTDLLRRWRRLSEEAAMLGVESMPTAASTASDADLIRFYASCFDRPAFQDLFHQEGNMEAFDRAIEDTITALNTGCLRARDGTVLQQAKGKAYIINHDWRAKLDTVADIVRRQSDPCRPADRSQPPPLSSRIIRAANAYDDLVGSSEDPSRAAEAVERLRLDTGSEYDPRVVEALSKLVVP